MNNVIFFPGSYRLSDVRPSPTITSGNSPTGAFVTLVGDNLMEDLDGWPGACRLTSFAIGHPSSVCYEAVDSLVALVVKRDPLAKMVCVVEGCDKSGWYLTAIVSAADVDDALALYEAILEIWPPSLIPLIPSFVAGSHEALHMIGRAGLLANSEPSAVA